MSDSRVSLRNVNYYNGQTGDHLGGVRQNGSITNANFFHMLMDILLVVDGIITISNRETGEQMPLNTNCLAEGDYNIFPSSGEIRSSEERYVRRVYSRRGRSRRDSYFRNAVRARDQRCVISGTVSPEADFDEWDGFEAAHVFPMERESLWWECGFDRFITRPGRHAMNSVQNGLLLEAGIHQRFDNFTVSVNPDDGYKITDFRGNLFHVDGRVLEFVCRNPANIDRVADGLLRWHFRQAVLANMRGAGEPIFEHDYPPGTDMMGEIMEGPFAAEQMELELFSRLRTVPSESEDSVY